jgi:alpha-glucosidase
MALKATGTKRLECDLFPWSDGTKVKTSAPMKSPWRTIIVGASPSDIVMSTLTLNLNEPNKLSSTSWIEPGKYIGVWWEMIGTNQSTWGSGPNHGATTEKVMKYIDFGSKHGFKGVLVEGWNKGWDQNWCCNGEGEDFGFYHPHPDFDHEMVRDYAKEKNIRIIGHHETGTQIENYERQLDSAFAYCQRNGIRVVKTGYVNDGSQNIKRTGEDGKIYKEWHHGQYMVEHFRKVLETAAKYEVSIVVHEPIKDTGIRRTFPNMISREGARGQEFNGFMGTKDNNKPNHSTILPFTRLISSPMDYTPGIFNLTEYRYFAPDNEKINLNHQIPSTISKELAHYVVIYAPVQMAADLPENYEGHPAFQFIKDVPTDWENSVCINGEIGEYITMVRKDINSDDWYLGSITNENSRVLSVSLSFLDSDKQYNATVYKDPETGGWKKRPEEVVIQSQLVDSGSELSIVIPPGGGQAIRFSPAN